MKIPVYPCTPVNTSPGAVKNYETPDLMFLHKDDAISSHLVMFDIWEGMASYHAVSKSWRGKVEIYCGLNDGWVFFE